MTVGTTYKASFFSLGCESCGRIQVFSSGGNDLVLDQDSSGNTIGILISSTYVATAATQGFHLYALANHEVSTD